MLLPKYLFPIFIILFVSGGAADEKVDCEQWTWNSSGMFSTSSGRFRERGLILFYISEAAKVKKVILWTQFSVCVHEKAQWS